MGLGAEHVREHNPDLERLIVWSDGHGSTYKGFQNFGRMAYWPLSRSVHSTAPPAAAEGSTCSGFCSDCTVDCRGIEVTHRFFESHHASGPQDMAGKAARSGMHRKMACDETFSVYDYNDCYEFTRSLIPDMKDTAANAYQGWAPDRYIWFALPIGGDCGAAKDPHREKHDEEFHLDLRTRDYSRVRGSNSAYHFFARKNGGKTAIWSQPLCCNCPGCRDQRITGRSSGCWHPEITGAFTEHKVRHRKTSGAEATKKKKADNKKKRQEKQQEKVAALALHNGIDEEDEEGEEGEEDAQPAVREVDGEVDGEVEVHLQFVRVADNSEAESDGDMSEDEGSGDEEEEGQVLSFVVHNLQVPLGVDLVSSEFTETGESQPVYIGEIDDQDENASVRKHNEAARLQGGMEIAKGDRIVAIDGASITGNVGDWAVDAAIAMLIELQKNGRAFSITVEREHKAEQDEDHETDDSERK